MKNVSHAIIDSEGMIVSMPRMNTVIGSADFERKRHSLTLLHDASSAYGISDPVYDESGTDSSDKSYFSFFSSLSAAKRSIPSVDSNRPASEEPLFALLKGSREERRQFREKIWQA